MSKYRLLVLVGDYSVQFTESLCDLWVLQRIIGGVRRWQLSLIAFAYFAIVLWVTLGPAPWSVHGSQLKWGVLNPRSWLEHSTWESGFVWEVVLNILLFVPVGSFLALLLPARGWIWAIFIGSALSFGIEVAQIVSPDRISDPRDLVVNTLGVIVGVVAVVLLRLTRSIRLRGRGAPRRTAKRP